MIRNVVQLTPKIDCKECGFNSCSDFATHIQDCNAKLSQSKFIHCRLEELRGSDDSIMELDETEIHKSCFRDIELLEEAYLCESDFESIVQDCTSENCRTDRDDLELFYCEIEKGLLFRRKKEVSIVLSSIGLDRVIYTGTDEEDDDEDED